MTHSEHGYPWRVPERQHGLMWIGRPASIGRCIGLAGPCGVTLSPSMYLKGNNTGTTRFPGAIPLERAAACNLCRVMG